MRVAVAGAEGHATVVADARPAVGDGEFVGFLDDDERLWGTQVAGYPVFGPIAARSACAIDRIAIAVGDNHRRKRHFEQLEMAGRDPHDDRPSACYRGDRHTARAWRGCRRRRHSELGQPDRRQRNLEHGMQIGQVSFQMGRSASRRLRSGTRDVKDRATVVGTPAKEI